MFLHENVNFEFGLKIGTGMYIILLHFILLHDNIHYSVVFTCLINPTHASAGSELMRLTLKP